MLRAKDATLLSTLLGVLLQVLALVVPLSSLAWSEEKEVLYYVTTADEKAKVFVIKGQDESGYLAGRDIQYESTGGLLGFFKTKSVYVDGEKYSLPEFQAHMKDLGYEVEPYTEPKEPQPTPQPFTPDQFLDAVRASLDFREPDGETIYLKGEDFLAAMAAHNVQIQVKNFWWEDYFVSYDPNTWESVRTICIDNNNGAWVASAVPVSVGVEKFRSLVLAHVELRGFVLAQMGKTEHDWAFLEAARNESIRYGADWAVFGANVYIQSLSMIVPGGGALDFWVSANSILEGRYLEGAVGMLPFAGRALKPGGKLVVKQAEKALGSFERPATEALMRLHLAGQKAELKFLQMVDFLIPALKSCDEAGEGLLGKIYCFPAGTLVLTKHGLLPIESVDWGVDVLSYCEATGAVGSRSTGPVASFIAPSVVSLSLRSRDVTETVTCTQDHPFYAERQGEHRWVAAGELVAGDRLAALGDMDVEVQGIQRIEHPTRVFTFVVDDLHTFFVSRLHVLTHNSECYKSAIKRLRQEAHEGIEVSEFLLGQWREEGSNYVRALLRRVDGKVSPNKAAIARDLRNLRPLTWTPDKGGLHEWLPVANVETAVLRAKNERALQSVLGVMREARTLTKNMVFKAKAKIGGKWPGHIGASGVTTKQWSSQLHNSLNQAFTDCWDPVSGLDKTQWFNTVKGIVEDYFSPEDAKKVIADIRHAL